MGRRRNEDEVLAMYTPRIDYSREQVLLVEVGCGLSTVPLSNALYEHDNVRLVCVDLDQDVIDLVRSRLDPEGRIEFWKLHSSEAMQRLREEGQRIDLAFFDGEPCAWTNWQDFHTIEPLLQHQSIFVMDNARFPGKEGVVPKESPGAACRKGKIIVPYLLGSPHWAVRAYPQYAGGMIAAVYNDAEQHWNPKFSLRGRSFEYVMVADRRKIYEEQLPQRSSHEQSD